LPNNKKAGGIRLSFLSIKKSNDGFRELKFAEDDAVGLSGHIAVDEDGDETH
jgi:hypothetical protein